MKVEGCSKAFGTFKGLNGHLKEKHLFTTADIAGSWLHNEELRERREKRKPLEVRGVPGPTLEPTSR